MRAGLAEMGRRAAGRLSGRLQSLPILALEVHSACNCRCVMCDIWKANADKREISASDLERHIAGIVRLQVHRVMLTGGEPLLHHNLWRLCDRLRAEGIRLTLVTTGLLVETCATEVARSIDRVVISVDGPPDVHDAIRRVRDGFARVARGVRALREYSAPPHVTARCVVQQANYARLADTVDAVHGAGFDQVSFLAADLTSTAFNREVPWGPARRAEIAVPGEALPALAAAIDEVSRRCRAHADSGFLAGGMASLRRIHEYYRAVAGLAEFPTPRCNAPWISAVLDAGGRVRPCFFHQPYPAAATVEEALNAPAARQFRRELRVATDQTCRRCVCSLALPIWQAV